MKKREIAAFAAAGLVLAGAAAGQSLYERPVKKSDAPPASTGATPSQQDVPGGGVVQPPEEAAVADDTPPRLEDVGLCVVVPPKPKTYGQHDLVQVIINESSMQKFEQSLDAKKKYDLLGELTNFPSIKRLLDAQLTNDNGGNSDLLPAKLGVSSDNKYKGDGTFERTDNFTARITATVMDVKPNGTLVIEARETIQSDKETSTMVLSGVCRSDDITKGNTIQSSQLANMTLRVEHEGQVKDTAEKGLIPRVLEAIFNF